MNPEIDILLDRLPEYKGDERLVSRRQDTFDIIREILKNHKRTLAHYDKIAGAFWKGDVPSTAENIYYFLKRHIPYKVEPTLKQTVKTPAAILEERYDFGNDCKHYASFIVGVCEALRRQGYPVKCFYRFASYNKKKRAPGHVFAVVVDQGREIWVDPVPEIGGFNRRVISPFYKIDKMPPMSQNGSSIGSLYVISGYDGIPIETTRHMMNGYNPDHLIAGHHHRHHWLEELGPGKMRSRLYHFRGQHKPPMLLPPGFNGVADIGKAKKGKKHHKGLHLKIKAPHIKINPGKLFKKVGLATSRNAYLLLVKLNVFHMATKIWAKAAHDRNSKEWKALAKKWENLGGDANKLYKEVKRGVNTYNKLHKSKKHIAVSGFDQEMIDGYEMPLSDHEIGMLCGVGEEMGWPDDIGYYHDDMSIGEILIFVHDNHHHRRMRHAQRYGYGMGVAQVAVAAGVIAAAAPIIKALAGLLKSFGVNTKKAEDATDQDAQNLAEQHNAEGDNVTADGTTVHADGTETVVENNPDGTQSMIIKKVPGLKDNEQGEVEQPGEDGTEETKMTVTKTKTKTKEVDTAGGGGFSDMLSNVTDFVKQHKTGVISTVGGLVLLGIGAAQKKRKGSMLKPALTITGLAALGFGGYKLFTK